MTAFFRVARPALPARARRLFAGDWCRPNVFDGGDLRRVMNACLVVHWLICGVLLVALLYRPQAPFREWCLYASVVVALVLFVGTVQFLVSTGRYVRWWFVLVFCTLDAVAASAGVAIGGGFGHDYLYLFYCPVVSASGILFASLRINFGWCTCVVMCYVVICLCVGDGVDLAGREGKVLAARVVVMYIVNGVLTLSCSLERARWMNAASREQALLDERAGLARSVHDTAAQLAYMVSLGLDTAVASAQDGGPPGLARLRATSGLARSLVWQLRHVVEMGGIYEGESLRSTVHFHSESFTNVTSVPSEFVCLGEEPPLSVESKRVVFAVAHNALANAYRHASATRVLVMLRCESWRVLLTVSDDGCGLPADYAVRGYGFRNMRAELARVGGQLVVQRAGPLGGASVGCEVPVFYAVRDAR